MDLYGATDFRLSHQPQNIDYARIEQQMDIGRLKKLAEVAAVNSLKILFDIIFTIFTE
jgi:hypothetical protein